MPFASGELFKSGWTATVLFLSVLVVAAALEAIRESAHPPAARAGLFSFHAAWGPPIRTISRRVLIIAAVVLLAASMFELGIHFKDRSTGKHLEVATSFRLPPHGIAARVALSSQAPLEKEHSDAVIATISTQTCTWKPESYDLTLATQALETTPFTLVSSQKCRGRWSAVATPKLSGSQVASVVVTYSGGPKSIAAATVSLGHIASAPYSIDTWLSITGIIVSNAVTICIAVFLPGSKG